MLDLPLHPASASWLNAVEGFFAKLTRRRLMRGIFRSVDDLKNRPSIASSRKTTPTQNHSSGLPIHAASSPLSNAANERYRRSLDVEAVALLPIHLGEQRIELSAIESIKFSETGAVGSLKQTCTASRLNVRDQYQQDPDKDRSKGEIRISIWFTRRR
jgi:hypothetical protein